jgi:hypothetical protein
MKSIHNGGKNTEPHYSFEEGDLYEHSNVKRIEFHHRLFDTTFDFGWNIEIEDDSNKNPLYEEYFYCDTLFHDAFGHWVFESAIYAPLFFELKKKHPNLKWIINKKKYKEIFFKAFGLETNDYSYEIKTHNNKIFFPFYLSLHDTTLDEKYKTKLTKFHLLLNKKLSPVEKTLDYLYLPRGTKEDFQPNNRTLLCQDDLIRHFSEKSNAKVLFTDEIDNYLDQMRIILSAKTIILDYGSSLFVNGFFSENAKIVCIGYNIHHEIHVPNRMIIELLKKNGNTIEFIKMISQDDSIPPNITFSKDEIISKIQG